MRTVELLGASGDDARRWRAALAAIAAVGPADIYFLPEYAALYEALGEGKAAAFVMHDTATPSGRVRAVVHPVLMRDIGRLPWAERLRDNPSGPWRDLTSPYGYGGPLATEEDPSARAELLTEFEAARTRLCEELGIVSEFVRFHPLLRTQVGCAPSFELTRRGETVWLELGDEEALLAAMTPGARNKVRRARSSGVTAAAESGAEAIRIMHESYSARMHAVDAPSSYFFPESYFAALARVPSDGTDIIIARLEGRPVWAGMFLQHGEMLHYHLSGSADGARIPGVSNLALLQAARRGAARGARKFHLGGGVGSLADSLFAFKASVGDRRAEFWTGSKVHVRDRYEALVEMRARGTADGRGSAGGESGYFPAYRAP